MNVHTSWGWLPFSQQTNTSDLFFKARWQVEPVWTQWPNSSQYLVTFSVNKQKSPSVIISELHGLYHVTDRHITAGVCLLYRICTQFVSVFGFCSTHKLDSESWHYCTTVIYSTWHASSNIMSNRKIPSFESFSGKVSTAGLKPHVHLEPWLG